LIGQKNKEEKCTDKEALATREKGAEGDVRGNHLDDQDET